MTKIALVCPILILTLLRTGKGQPKIQFDAATVKVDQRGPGFVGMRGGPGTGSPGRVTWRREWLRELVATAFHVDSMNVSGPEWIAYMGAPVYAVTATMPPDTPKHDFELMLQSLLIEQFDLQVHHEPKLFPEYELVIAPGGSRLKASEKADADEVPLGPPRVGADGFPIMPPGHGQRVSLINGFHARFQNYSMAEFAEHLSDFITPPGERRRYVVDRTGSRACTISPWNLTRDACGSWLDHASNRRLRSLVSRNPGVACQTFSGLWRGSLGLSW